MRNSESKIKQKSFRNVNSKDCHETLKQKL